MWMFDCQSSVCGLPVPCVLAERSDGQGRITHGLNPAHGLPVVLLF